MVMQNVSTLYTIANIVNWIKKEILSKDLATTITYIYNSTNFATNTASTNLGQKIRINLHNQTDRTYINKHVSTQTLERVNSNPDNNSSHSDVEMKRRRHSKVKIKLFNALKLFMQASYRYEYDRFFRVYKTIPRRPRYRKNMLSSLVENTSSWVPLTTCFTDAKTFTSMIFDRNISLITAHRRRIRDRHSTESPAAVARSAMLSAAADRDATAAAGTGSSATLQVSNRTHV